jgi:membrane protein implicated in regulation of membrane protease activity
VNWESFYLVCFVAGFSLSLLGLLSGALHWPIGHDAHGWHFGSHVVGHGPAHAGGDGSSISPFNLATVMAFLAWFGGMGYLLTGRGHLGQLVVLGAALLTGVAGSAIVFVFLTKVLLKHERFLESADFEMTGVLGRVTVGIREEGTGEIVYSQEGTRRSAGARSENGTAIPRGSEVVVTRYDRGIAYVRPWEELAGETKLDEPSPAEKRT